MSMSLSIGRKFGYSAGFIVEFYGSSVKSVDAYHAMHIALM